MSRKSNLALVETVDESEDETEFGDGGGFYDGQLICEACDNTTFTGHVWNGVGMLVCEHCGRPQEDFGWHSTKGAS